MGAGVIHIGDDPASLPVLLDGPLFIKGVDNAESSSDCPHPHGDGIGLLWLGIVLCGSSLGELIRAQVCVA